MYSWTAVDIVVQIFFVPAMIVIRKEEFSCFCVNGLGSRTWISSCASASVMGSVFLATNLCISFVAKRSKYMAVGSAESLAALTA